jgi:hypothetical protein
MNRRQRVLIFVHIQKTAGSTVRWIIQRHYAQGRVLELGKTRDHLPLEQFRLLPQAERDQYDCLIGHIPYGLHELVSRPADYITFLRDPLERAASQFYYICRTPANRIYPLVAATGFSIAEYARNEEFGRPDNMQVRYVIGAGTEGQMTPDDLERAKIALCERYACFGLAERFDESLVLLRRALGWGQIYYLKQNVTASRPPLAEIPGEALEIFARKYALDAALHEFAQAEFERRINALGVRLTGELAALRILSAAYRAAVVMRAALAPAARERVAVIHHSSPCPDVRPHPAPRTAHRGETCDQSPQQVQ